jgi:FAD:protein FMN transferase
MERHAFRAMGTDVELLLDAFPSAESAAALEQAQQELHRLEALLSRFLPGSELSALNRLGSLEAGDDLLAVTRLSLEARTRTGGLFDPTVHDALVAAGYDRTFEEVGDVRAAARSGSTGTGSSSSAASGSTSGASPRAGPSTGRPPSSRRPDRASSTPAATSPPAAARGLSASRRPKGCSRSRWRTARRPRRAGTGAAGGAAVARCIT